MTDRAYRGTLFDEIISIARMVSPDFDAGRFGNAFNDMVAVYRGDYPGYKACNTNYHDLHHVFEVTLATVRIAHSAQEAGYCFDRSDLLLLLVSAMAHDTGYIQPSGDDSGTGGKYTLIHVDRSIDFTRDYLAESGFSREAIDACSVCIKATDLAVPIRDIRFIEEKWECLAKIMATADMIAQIADRCYLEKLLLLYKEFEEGAVPGFASELDLLKNTLNFYEAALHRMDYDLGGFRRHMKLHFEKRWGLPDDRYQKRCDANMKYLAFLLENHEENYRGMLNRGSIVERLSSMAYIIDYPAQANA